jgi:putative spermidine/putrescine transport system permease protein
MKKSKLAPVLLLAPFFLIMAVFLAGLTAGVLQAFGYIPAFGLRQFTLTYFQQALADPNLLASVGVSLYVASASATVATVLAVLLCFALVTLKKDRGVLYAVVKTPMFIPWAVTGLLMIHLLSGGGWLARLCARLGLTGAAAAIGGVLHSRGQLGVVIAFVWACTPFACFLIQSVMSQVTDTLGEAAVNLGAGLWRRFWNITLPLCGPAIRSTFLILLLSCFGSYEIPALLGMTVPRALPVEIYYQYNHYDLRHRPYAMALNTAALALALGLAGLALLLGRRGKRKGDGGAHES